MFILKILAPISSHPYWAAGTFRVIEYGPKLGGYRRPALGPYGNQNYIFRQYIYNLKNVLIIIIIFRIGLCIHQIAFPYFHYVRHVLGITCKPLFSPVCEAYTHHVSLTML